MGGQPASVDMGLEVVDGQERNALCQANCLGGDESHEQGARQARGIGYGHGVDVFQSKARFVQGLVDYGQDALDVRPGGDLRNHSAETAMQIVLRGHDRG